MLNILNLNDKIILSNVNKYKVNIFNSITDINYDVIICDWNDNKCINIIAMYKPVIFIITNAYLLNIRDVISNYIISNNNDYIIGFRSSKHCGKYCSKLYDVECIDIIDYLIECIYTEIDLANKFTQNIKNKTKDSKLLEILINDKYTINTDLKKVIGEYCATEYLFSENKKVLDKYNYRNNKKHNNCVTVSKEDFYKYFGVDGKWSCAEYGKWNNSGQILFVTQNNDLIIIYNYKYDKRDKHIPKFLQNKNVVIAYWSHDKLNKHIDKKFNKGQIICNCNKNIYTSISFVQPFDYDYFIHAIKSRQIVLQHNMHKDSKNYTLFKSTTQFWTNLTVKF